MTVGLETLSRVYPASCRLCSCYPPPQAVPYLFSRWGVWLWCGHVPGSLFRLGDAPLVCLFCLAGLTQLLFVRCPYLILDPGRFDPIRCGAVERGVFHGVLVRRAEKCLILLHSYPRPNPTSG
ncbi:unnamed protein product, partial [Scytosiphon promiscuus]